MNGPSRHLSWKELACKDGTPYPEKWIPRARELAQIFETIRYWCGGYPIIVYSAYRTPSHNKKIGGAPKSQHLVGKALDLHHTKLTNEEFYKIIHSNTIELGITGLGKYLNFVHVDIREPRTNGKLSAWRGHGVKDSVIRA